MTKLYTPEILALAVELAEYPRLPDADLHAEARSRTCGGTLALDIVLDEGGRVAALGLGVSACAIGQAAAAIFARGAPGRAPEEMLAALGEIETWLGGGDTLPHWPGITVLEPAKAFAARHGAITLPWKAAVEALCKERAAR